MEMLLIGATFFMTVTILYHVLKTEKLACKREEEAADDVADDGRA